MTVPGAISPTLALALVPPALSSTAGAAEPRRGADHLAVVLEAEDHETRDERRVLTVYASAGNADRHAIGARASGPDDEAGPGFEWRRSPGLESGGRANLSSP